jgi:hypothetical protein
MTFGELRFVNINYRAVSGRFEIRLSIGSDADLKIKCFQESVYKQELSGGS